LAATSKSQPLQGKKLTVMDRMKRFWILDFGLQSSTLLSVSFAFILTISVHPCLIPS
jgi:hypothetical protein